MAKKLTNIPTNITEYPNSFKRQGAFPLDAYSVFYSYEDASEYAQGNPIAYVGQILVVVKTDQYGELNCSLYMIKDEIGTLEPITTLTSLDLKAPIQSPTFTGTPKAPTPATTTSNTQIATTKFVHNLLDDITVIEIDGKGVPTSNYANWNGEFEGYNFKEN